MARLLLRVGKVRLNAEILTRIAIPRQLCPYIRDTPIRAVVQHACHSSSSSSSKHWPCSNEAVSVTSMHVH